MNSISQLGSTIVTVVTLLVAGYVGGYYHHRTIVKSRLVKTELIASENEQLTKDYEGLKELNDARIADALSSLGFQEEQIVALTKRNTSLKDSIERGITKYLPGKTIYIPSEECGMVGTDDGAELFNDVIQKGLERRARFQ